jgi:hypothetical protein
VVADVTAPGGLLCLVSDADFLWQLIYDRGKPDLLSVLGREAAVLSSLDNTDSMHAAAVDAAACMLLRMKGGGRWCHVWSLHCSEV